MKVEIADLSTNHLLQVSGEEKQIIERWLSFLAEIRFQSWFIYLGSLKTPAVRF